MARQITPEPTPIASGALTPELIGQFVRARRTQSQLRLVDAAQLCGVSIDTLSKIETAKSGVNVESLLKVLNGLGIKITVIPW